jgi:histidinol-phosphate aminotransferase
MKFLDSVPTHIRAIPAYKSENPAEEVERELGLKVVQLGMNENAFGPSPRAVDAIRRYAENVEQYPDDSGYSLREKLATHFRVSMDEIIVSSGSTDILAMAYHALASAQAEVLTGESSFVVYYQLAEIRGMPVVRVPMKDYGFDLPAMAEQINANTRLIAIANPNNPTGTMISRDVLDLFISKVPDHVLVILDEAYFEYVEDETYPKSLEYVSAGRPVLILRTFSKAYGLAGLRIGFGISTREVIDTLYKVRMAFNTSSIAQVAALAAWDDRAHVEKSVRMNRTELEFLYGELSRRGVRYVPSFANFLLLETGKEAREVCGALLKKGVIVRPAWGCPAAVRVSVGTRDQNEKFLAALDRTL